MTTITKKARIKSIDALRGLVIIIMALDHTREFLGPVRVSTSDIANISSMLFFTRWITNFCAPAFFILVGIGSFLYGSNPNRNKFDLFKFLMTRGIWLIFIELTVVAYGWYAHIGGDILKLKVLWALGCSMIFLGLIIWFPKWVITFLAILIIAGHNLLDGINPGQTGIHNILFGICHVYRYKFHFLGEVISVSYPLVPWIGITALGYIVGPIFKKEKSERDKILLSTGITFIIMFIVLRWINLYGEPKQWLTFNSLLLSLESFLNTSKYPVSLLFTLMTLGPFFIFLWLFEKFDNKFTTFLNIFGKAPFFFYILHIYMIRWITSIHSIIFYGRYDKWWFGSSHNWPEAYHQNLFLVYGVWIAVIAIMFPLCYWFKNIKSKHKNWWWLSYF